MSSTSKPEIIVAGNSHVRYLLGPIGSTERDHGSFIARGRQFGSTGATIYGLSNPDSRTNAGRDIANLAKEEADKLPPTEGLKLVLCLGEVDVRNHILKHSTSVKSCADMIWELIYRYEAWLAENIEDHCGANLCLMGSVPYTRKFFSEHHPSRKFLTGYLPGLFNSALLGLCNERDWTYIDVYEPFVDDDGFLLDEYAADPTEKDDCHLNHLTVAKFIVPQIERYLANRR